RLVVAHLGRVPRLDPELLSQVARGASLGEADVFDREERVDGAAGDVLAVDPGLLAELGRDLRVEAPARDRQLLEGRRRRVAQGREHSRRGARGLGPRRGPLEERDSAAGPGQLVRRRAADDPAADDDDLHAVASASRNRRVASAGESAARMDETTATPRAPARRTSRTRSGVGPPIATTRMRAAAATRASLSR